MTAKCTARSKRTGQQCNNPPMKGKTVCRMHGGKTPSSVQAGSFKSGRYSRYIPARLLDRYNDARNDPELLALRDEVGLIDSRLSDLLSRVDTGESGAIWKQAKQLVKDFEDAKQLSEVGNMQLALDALFHIINKGLGDYAAWNEIQSSIEQRRRLVESERKRLVEMQQVITAERATVLVFRILDVLKRNIPDRQLLITIGKELTALLTVPESQSNEVLDLPPAEYQENIVSL